ncbi:hypothetical protein YM304_29800 [Ilumatobacter coccineus YM16-304]|uniref:SGNH hydrolase-type esterase domain-containing protein n=2 Tax=Ilumatobacter coccineus TaxID=467094 RepID=A0A6C7E6E7_ILUCY|nr:hypothetical protein YM304_29800 [Ilumatobacter coccineus YM16-304]
MGNYCPAVMGRAKRLQRVLAGLALLAATGIGSTAPPATVGADSDSIGHDSIIRSPPPIQIDRATVGPLGSVSVIGDSVLHGAGRYSPTLVDRLAEQGWGPIRFRAGAGYSTGYFGRSPELTSTYWLAAWRDEGWNADNVIVNLGANDTEFCETDVDCAYRAIMHVVDDIGPGPYVWWPKVTKFYTHTDQANAWNAALDRVAAERSDFFTWDWPTELATGGYGSNDNTHLLPSSYPKRSQRMAEEFTNAVARARPVGGSVDLSVARSEPSTWVPIAPTRLVDTRTDAPGAQSVGDVLRLDLTDEVPTGTTAVALYVAAARPTGAGFLTAGPCGPAGESATVTFDASGPRGAPTVVAVDDSDDADDALAVCVSTGGPTGTTTDVVVDLQGAFVTGDDGMRLHPLEAPTRVADTRPDGATTELTLDAPTGASSLAVNIAVAGATAPGYVTAAPCGVEAPTANLNFRAGPPASAAAFVEVGDDGTVCITASTAVDLVADLTATFRPAPDGGAADGGLAFVAIEPLRMLDTRDGTGGWAPLHGAGQQLAITASPPWAAAVTGTLTMIRPRTTAYVSATNCADADPVASANAAAGATVSNALTTGVADAGVLCVLSSSISNTVFDATGWWADVAANA